MSKYTTEVRYICEVAAGRIESAGFNDIEAILEASYSSIFNFTYPIFTTMPEFQAKFTAEELAALKKEFEKKILCHYYIDEIGAETVGLWKLFLQQKLFEIMPYYNKLYASELLEFDPFENVNLKDESNRASSSASETNRDTSNFQNSTGASSGSTSSQETPQSQTTHYDLFSNTPESSLSGVDNERYLTDARKITDTHTGTGTDGAGDLTEGTSESLNAASTSGGDSEKTTGASSGTDITASHQHGKSAGETYSEMLTKYRDTILNIDKLVLEELRDCFMYIY